MSAPTLPEPSQVKNILIVRADHLGDLIMGTVLIPPLQARYPQAKLYFLVQRGHGALVRCLPGVAGALEWDLDDKQLRNPLKAWWAARKFCRFADTLHFDLGIDPKGLWLNAGLLHRLDIPHRVGFADGGGGFLLTQVVSVDQADTPFERLEKLLAHLECVVPRPLQAHFPVYPARQTDTQAVLVFPGASEVNKRWPWERFQDLIERMLQQTPFPVKILGGPAEASWLLAAVQHWNPDPARVQVELLQSTAALIEAMRSGVLVLSNDAAPAHLAAAMDIPSITLFGAQDPADWHPYDPVRHAVLYAYVACRPCGLRYCPLIGADYIRCLKHISVDEVFLKVQMKMNAHD